MRDRLAGERLSIKLAVTDGTVKKSVPIRVAGQGSWNLQASFGFMVTPCLF